MSFSEGFEKIAFTPSELKEIIPEHKKLIRILRSGSKKTQSEEAGKQKEELQEYEAAAERQ